MRLPSGPRLVTASEMAAIDHAAISRGVSASTLMERAGKESARAIVTWWRGISGPKPGAARRRTATPARPTRGRAIVLAGRGNNGGDGFVCARHLKAAGFTVRVLVAAEEHQLAGEAAQHHAACEKERIPITFLPDERAWGQGSEAAFAAREAMFLVDALLGTGSKGAPRGAVAAAIEMAERNERPIASIDIPSGLDASTGYVEQPAIRADFTVTLQLLKRGLELEPGRSHAGDIEVVDIGIPQAVIEEAIPAMLTVDPDWARSALPVRPMDAHKGSVGRALIVGGSGGMVGAVGMASEAALRVGAGYVVAAVPMSCVDPLEARLAEVVKRGLPETSLRTLSLSARDEILAEAIRADVVALGPGLSRHPETLELARELVERVEAPLVLDADGLNAFEGIGVHRTHGPLVLTPHYAEAARLSGQSVADLARDPAGWARRFADESHAIVCLKSTPMITAVLAEPMILNATGNPGMATAGAGDVLTGTIAGLIAQGVDAEEAGVLGCFLHGLAGDVAARRLGMRGLIAGDIVRALPAAITALESGALGEG